MRSILFATFFFALLPNAHADEVPFAWSVPPGWRTETITFPLPFAPELPHRGLVELRFSPGMFKADSEELWTYSFVWWLEGETKLEAPLLTKQLEQYFAGLTKLVEEDRARHPTPVTAKLEAVAKTSDRFEGTVSLHDAFATHRQVQVNVRVRVFDCPLEKRTVAQFQLSPQPSSHAVWKALDRLASTFQCSRKR
jgi:hypothetical protein